MVVEQVYINIKKRRNELGMSQDELARRAGYTDRSSIAKIELGKVDISLGTLKKIAAALDADPIDLLGWWQ